MIYLYPKENKKLLLLSLKARFRFLYSVEQTIIIKSTLFYQQIKTGTHFDSENPDFTSYTEMVDMPTVFETYTDKSPTFEQFFSTPFVGRYVVIMKKVGNESGEAKVLTFGEVMVWFE